MTFPPFQSEMYSEFDTERHHLEEEWQEKLEVVERELDSLKAAHLIELDGIRESLRVCQLGFNNNRFYWKATHGFIRSLATLTLDKWHGRFGQQSFN